MISTIDEDMAILEKYGLCPNELFVIRAFMLLQEDDNSSILARYCRIPEYQRGTLGATIQSLQNKGIVLKSYQIPHGSNFDPLDVPFNKTFIKGFYKASFDMGKELFETYPMFGNVNGHPTAIRSVSKKFNSIEDFYVAYGKAINWNPETHKHIIELLEWAKNYTSVVQWTLANFVIDRHWITLEALKDGEISNINFNTVTDL